MSERPDDGRRPGWPTGHTRRSRQWAGHGASGLAAGCTL